MRVSTLIRYLLGSQRAILELAGCRRVVWLGLLFVISAGFAREYDGEDLLHQPLHLVLPLWASLLTSFLLFVLLEAAFPTRDQGGGGELDSFFPRYRAFLGLYWMTAPLAWLYAVPVERFMDAADAVRFNLWLLAVVALWRVVVMIRVVSVIYARSAVASVFVVMLMADSVAMVILWLTPLPIFTYMGGIRLTESEQLIQTTGFFVRLLGIATWPIWLIGALTVAIRTRHKSTRWLEVLGQKETPAITPWLWALALFSILIWMPILPFTQVEQINRRRVERALRAGHIHQAIQYMSQRDRDEFPPHWDPPPRIGYGEAKPHIVDVLLQLEPAAAAPWVWTIYRQKLVVQSGGHGSDYPSHAIQLWELKDDQLALYVKLLQSLPEGPAMARYHEAEIRALLDPEHYGLGPEYYGGGAKALSQERRDLLEAIHQLVPDDESPT